MDDFESAKRSISDLDPDYEDFTEQQQKKQRILQDDAKGSTIRKIENIINKHFDIEIRTKEEEVQLIDERLHEARKMLDRLRACIVANYYTGAGQLTGQTKIHPNQPPVIHPTVKKYLGKTVKQDPSVVTSGEKNTHTPVLPSSDKTKVLSNVNQNGVESKNTTKCSGSTVTKSRQGQGQVHPRCLVRKRLIVGNVSKYIPRDKRDDNDQATHKWMVYVRGPRDQPGIDHYVKKVWFFLHPSYRPNDLVQVSQPPFHLTRRGWGEFPIRVQLHFVDSRNKRVDIIHHLKLDKTYTGLQTLGTETVVDIELDRASFPEEHIVNLPPQPSAQPPETPSGSNPNHTQPPPEPMVSAERLLETSLAEIKQEMESENSLGVVWSHDQPQSCDRKKTPHFDLGGEQSIVGNGDVMLSSGAFKELDAIVSSPVKNVTPVVPPGRTSQNKRNRTPSKLQISRSQTPQGWTRLQIKQEDRGTPPSSGYHRTPEIKEEPLDDSYPRTSSRASSGYTPIQNNPDVGFRPVSAEPNTPGWTHVQIKSEPVTPDRPISACSYRSDHNRSICMTPEKESLSSAPTTPDRVVRFELGRTISPGLKLNVADTKNMLNLQKQSEQTRLEAPLDFANWKQTQQPPGGSMMKQTVTLGVGVGQLSTSAQSSGSQSTGAQNTGQANIGSQKPMENVKGKAMTLKTILTEHTTVANTAVSSLPEGSSSPAGQKESTPTSTGSRPVPKLATNPETVYIQCVDSAGKVYLIPQQMLKTSTGLASKLTAKPQECQSPKDSTKTKTTVVGSGPNKATLTYMLSPQGLAGVRPIESQDSEGKTDVDQGSIGAGSKPIVTQTSKVPRAAAPLVPMATGSGLAQKLLVIPGSSAGNRQMAFIQQPKPEESRFVSPTIPIGVGGATSQPQQVLIRDQAGNMQIVQMAPSIPAARAPGIQASLTPRIPTQKTGICVSTNLPPGVRSVLSPPAKATQQDGGVRVSLQGSPLKSLVIPKETFGQLQPGQLLQIQIPPNKGAENSATTLKSPPGGGLSSRRPDAAVTTAVTETASNTTPQLMVITGGAQGPGSIVAKTSIKKSEGRAVQGMTTSKPQGSVSLLRPGLITNKLSASVPSMPTGGAMGSKASTGSDTSSVATVISGPVGNNSINTKTSLGSVGMTNETSKRSLIGQSLLKSASTGSLLSLQQKQEDTKNDKLLSQTTRGIGGSPFFLSTKIGNQTVLLKIDQPLAGSKADGGMKELGGAKEVCGAKEVGGVKVVDGAKAVGRANEFSGVREVCTNTAIMSFAKGNAGVSSSKVPESSSTLVSSGKHHARNVPQVSALSGACSMITATIKHGSILGMHKTKEHAKPEAMEINPASFCDLESLLSYAVARFPLVAEDVDRSIYPYCARSHEEFLKWNIGKRRAAEWQRASRLRRKIISTLNNETCFHGNQILSTKEMLTWCRLHRYTPLDKTLSANYSTPRLHTRQPSNLPTHPPGGFNSYTNHQGVLKIINETCHSPEGSTEEEEIDIIGTTEPMHPVIKTEPMDTDSDTDAMQGQVVPPSGVSQFIHQVAAQVGVNFDPVPVRQDNGGQVLLPLSEEVLLMSMKCFMERMIRKASALRAHTNRFMDDLSARDIYNTIQVLPRHDFLLNQNLGSQPWDSRVIDGTANNI